MIPPNRLFPEKTEDREESMIEKELTYQWRTTMSGSLISEKQLRQVIKALL